VLGREHQKVVDVDVAPRDSSPVARSVRRWQCADAIAIMCIAIGNSWHMLQSIPLIIITILTSIIIKQSLDEQCESLLPK
jgi:hypothetical protein